MPGLWRRCFGVSTESTARSLLEGLRQTVEGAEVIADWIGEGGVPVPRELAEKRATICQYCPENYKGNWWDETKNTIAMWIRRELELKNSIGLTLSNETQIAMCKICGCANRLKVWTPIEHIRAHTTDLVFECFPKACWIKDELTKH